MILLLSGGSWLDLALSEDRAGVGRFQALLARAALNGSGKKGIVIRIK